MNKIQKQKKGKQNNADTVYIVDAQKLQPGDIFLTTQATSNISRTIRAVTDSEYSHVALSFLHSNCIEAVGTGVRIISLDRVHVSDKKNIRILRLQNPDIASVAEKAATIAKSHICRPYWTKGAIVAPIPNTGTPSDQTRFFCSHLVAQCYQDAGLNLFPGKLPEKVVPGDFIDVKDVLEDVTDSIVKPVLKEHAPSSALDIDGYPESGEDDFVILSKNISKDVLAGLKDAKWVKRFRGELHQFPRWYAVFFLAEISDQQKQRYDNVLLTALKKHGFNEFLTKGLQLRNKWTFISLEEWKQLVQDSNLTKDQLTGEKQILANAIQTLNKSLAVYKADLNEADEAWKKNPKVEKFKAAVALLDFNKERVSETEKHLGILEAKMNFLVNLMLSKGGV